MEIADLPQDTPHVPIEEAYQPQRTNKITKILENSNKTKNCITFADKMETDESYSQSKSSYKDILSQPAPGLSHKQRMLWLQKRRSTGLWVQCDDCNRWRYLMHALDSYELPKNWYCRLHPDPAFANCSVAEIPIKIRDEEDLIHSEYSCGSLVWARMAGWPWWPAMVDDCPDAEQYYWLDGFSDIPTHYNVVFFDTFEATRAWIAPDQLKPYVANRNLFQFSSKAMKHKKRLEEAIAQADDAAQLPVKSRLTKYSFISRFRGHINIPKRVTKKDLKKFQQQLKRKFNLDFPIESSDESTDEKDVTNKKNAKEESKKNNLIYLGTSKGTKLRKGKEMKSVNKNKSLSKAIEKSKLVEDELHNNDQSVQPDSMAVQVGSTEDSNKMNSVFGNDTSTTYVPDSVGNKTLESQDSNVRATTPTSDDFDF